MQKVRQRQRPLSGAVVRMGWKDKGKFLHMGSGQYLHREGLVPPSVPTPPSGLEAGPPECSPGFAINILSLRKSLSFCVY